MPMKCRDNTYTHTRPIRYRSDTDQIPIKPPSNTSVDIIPITFRNNSDQIPITYQSNTYTDKMAQITIKYQKITDKIPIQYRLNTDKVHTLVFVSFYRPFLQVDAPQSLSASVNASWHRDSGMSAFIMSASSGAHTRSLIDSICPKSTLGEA